MVGGEKAMVDEEADELPCLRVLLMVLRVLVQCLNLVESLKPVAVHVLPDPISPIPRSPPVRSRSSVRR